MNKFKKAFILFLILIISTLQTVPAIAVEAPTAPSAPAAPAAPSQPSQPSAPSVPSQPSAPTPSQSPSQNSDSQNNQSSPAPSSNPTDNQQSSNQTQVPSPSPTNSTQNSPAPSSSPTTSAQNGDTFVQTGDANNIGNIATTGNQNTQTSPISGNTSGTQLSNIGNGSNSQNNSTASLDNNKTTTQNNSGNVTNNLNQSTITGKNSATDNVGDSIVKTGDANVTGTVLTHLNTNISGVAVSEFNIEDDHTGDYVLDFASGCISGCQNFNPLLAQNNGNGANSQNNASLIENTNSNTFQENDATVESNLVLKADSGNNLSSRNTGGDSYIETGDANVAANALTFVNNNLSGNVLLGVVNIFGDLIGNLILPESALTQGSCQNCGSNAVAGNIGNGSNSQNSANIEQITNDTTFQTSVAEIENDLLLNSETGNNDTSKNTGGVSYAKTGNSDADAKVLNIANSNINGGNWWLVVVNEAGKWVGKILGAPEGSNFAGSAGTEFVVDDQGEVTAINKQSLSTNKGNGSGSDNNTNISQNINNANVQTNTAKVKNNLDLSANTGNNKASYNTGGDSVVKTGDANILANIVNFVNNNIAGNGRLVVTLVNVFGSWDGDFVTPGTQPTPAPTTNPTPTPSSNPNTGGTGNTNLSPTPSSDPTNTGSGNSSNSGNTGSSNSQNTTGSTNASTNTSGGTSFNTQVAGFSAEVQGTTAEIQFPFAGKGKDLKTKIRINLAWLLVALPAGTLAYVAYKKLKMLKAQN